MTVLWPNGSTRIPHVTSEFGPRRPFPGVNTGTFHHGIDLVGWANNKSPVDGVVIFAGYNGGAGNEVRIRADNGDVYAIFHNARIFVRVGQRVAAGQDVGVMGSTGASTGIHCHFETRPRGGAAINPRVFIAQANAGTAGGGGTPINPEEDDMLADEREALFAIKGALLDGVPEEGMARGRLDVIFESANRIRGARTLADGTPNPEWAVGDVLQWIRSDVRNAGRVDAKVLAAELAPLLEVPDVVAKISDDDLDTLVGKLLDEQARRLAE